MHELTRDEVQDRLVDLVHGRLSGAELALVEQAVAADVDLGDELRLLRSVHGALRGAPALDVAAIVAALPTPSAMAPIAVTDDLAMRRATRQRGSMRRFARAAAVLAVLGGGTMIALSRGGVQSPSEPAAVTALGSDTAGAAPMAMQLSLGASVDELSIEQLDALQTDIKALDGLPSADLDAATDLLAGEGA